MVKSLGVLRVISLELITFSSGGLLVFLSSKDFLHKLQPRLDELEQQGVWRQVRQSWLQYCNVTLTVGTVQQTG